MYFSQDKKSSIQGLTIFKKKNDSVDSNNWKMKVKWQFGLPKA